MAKELVNKTIAEGGTGITNISPNNVEIAKATLRELNDPDYVFSNIPLLPATPLRYSSIHYLGNNKNYSTFWKVFWRIKKELSEIPNDKIKVNIIMKICKNLQ